jgi:murein DD-endopeptidase MepM/ murein hydrolase activator NlpD
MAAAAKGAAPSLAVQPQSVQQGGFLIATLSGADELAATCRWLNGRYPMFRDGETLAAVLPTTYDTRPGWHILGVSARHGSNLGTPLWLEKKVRVIAVRFPVQRLRMGRKQLKLYTDPRIKREYALIRQALNSLTSHRSWALPLLKPAEGRVSTGYGVKRVVSGTLRTRHRGVDIASVGGSPVRACAAGTVALARPDFILHGKTVIIDHGWGVCSVYLHLQEILTEEGRAVNGGEIIGLVGSTGAAAGPHLHWAVYVHGKASDPRIWLKAHQSALP